MQLCSKAALLALFTLCVIGSSIAKPKVRVAADGFPTGQATPEGAATDLARAFMKRDPAGFRDVCIRPYGGGPARADYVGYLDGVLEHLKNETRESPDDPKKIARVFAARHLSKNGPASYGYASFGFRDVMFVDVEVILRNGRSLLRRTMVIQDRDGKRYAHPVPDVSPLLSYGFYDESVSTVSFTEAYEIEH
jgi:hypothetical protein